VVAILAQSTMSFDRLRPLRKATAGLRYTAAAVIVAAALAAIAVLEPVMEHAPSAPLFAVLLAISWLFGMGPALFGAAVALVPLAYLVDESHPRWYADQRDIFWILLFFITALATAWLASTVRRLEDERTALLVRERAARAEAEAANRAKDNFLAIVSHELRSPLTAILGWCRMLRSGRLPPADGDRALDTIERSTRLQAKLVEDLLDVSRAAAGKLDITTRSVDLSAVAEHVVESHRPRADAVRVHLIGDVSGGVAVLGDAERLQQVIGNLVANALKFTPAGGDVVVSVRRDADIARIVVRDTGEGVDPTLLPHVFDRFRRGDSASRGREGGLGLGLAIVKYIVEAHGGVVRAESAGSGAGATFTVDLPLEAAKRTLTSAA